MPGNARNQNPVVRVAPYTASGLQYDQLLARPMLPLLIRHFLRSSRRLKLSAKTVADVGCGSGRFLQFLVGLGLDVCGVDNSAAMLRLARRRNQSGRVRLLKQDLRALNLPAPVDLITCQFDTLNYMQDWRDLSLAFRRLAANLVLGGYLLFDMIVLRARAMRPMIRQFRVRSPHCETSWLIVTTASGLRRAQLDTRCRNRFGDLHSSREVHVQRAWPLAIILRCLRKAGLELISLSDGHKPGEPRIFFEAQLTRQCHQ